MTGNAERPPGEDRRLAAVRRYDILDTPPDGAFDRVTALAARFCNVPVSTITIVDEDRIWFKSAHGVDVDQIGRDPGLCASAIIRPGPHIVTDAVTDPRTLDNPLVRGELGLRFYVGIPLTTTDGYRLGTLNIIDGEPREVTETELETLRDLAAIVMDELELRLAARRTVEIEAAREAAEFRESLLAGVSHEMRTAIAVLHGTIGLDPGDDVDLGEIQAMQRRHVVRLDWLINQYLDYTAIETGRPPKLNPEATDLGQLVRRATDVLATDANIEIDVEPGLPPARADVGRTRQVVIELLNNAVRFGSPDATVAVEVRARDRQLTVAVTNRGATIPARDHGRVFDKMYRAGTETGSGIGLFVSRALAEAQDGSIEVESHPEEDTTTFTLVLPAVT